MQMKGLAKMGVDLRSVPKNFLYIYPALHTDFVQIWRKLVKLQCAIFASKQRDENNEDTF